MASAQGLARWIVSHTSRWSFSVALVALIVLTGIIAPQAQHVLEGSGHTHTLDMRVTGYTAQEAEQLLAALGAKGCSAYMEFYRLACPASSVSLAQQLAHSISSVIAQDLAIYPFVLAIVLSMGVGSLMRWARLPLQPCLCGLAYFLSDLVENVGVYFLLWSWPQFFPTLAAALGWVTIVKYGILLSSVAFMVAAGTVILGRQVAGNGQQKRQ